MNDFKIGEIVAVNSKILSSLPREQRNLASMIFFKIKNRTCYKNNVQYIVEGITKNYKTYLNEDKIHKLYKNNKLNKKLYCGKILEETEEWLIVK